jgi:predicted Zn finger-like uncharacterized protein
VASPHFTPIYTGMVHSIMEASPHIAVVCNRCKASFPVHHSKIRLEASLVCASCGAEVVITANSPDDNMRKALSAARRYRLGANNGFAKPIVRL